MIHKTNYTSMKYKINGKKKKKDSMKMNVGLITCCHYRKDYL